MLKNASRWDKATQRFRRAALLIALAAGAVALSARGFYEPDLWWHLAQGREDAAGRLVRSNVFSFLHPEYRQHYTAWLFDTVAFGAWSFGGGAAIQSLQGLLVALALGLSYMACRAHGPPAAAASVLLLGFFVIEPRAIPRPHLVSLAGMAACSLALARARMRGSAQPLWSTIPLVALWSNFHVEAVFGVVLLGVAALSEWLWPRWWARAEAGRAILIVLGCVVATLATPYGWGLWQYLLENTTVPAMLDIAELQPPYLPNYRAFWIYLSAAGLLLVLPPRRFHPGDALLLLVFGALGARYLRLTPLVFLASAPAVTARLAALLEHGLDRRALLITAAVVAAASSRVPLRVLATELRAGDAAVRPVGFFSEGAVAFARREGLKGPVFNSNNLGGYLAWSLYPDVRIFQDSRLQAAPPGFFRAIVRASGHQETWDALTSPVDWAVLSLARPGELSGVGRFPRRTWATVYWDEAAQIVIRRGGAYDTRIHRNEYGVVLPGVDPFAIAARLRAADAPRILDEARRNLRENPRGYLAPAVLCLSGDAAACGELDRLANDAPAVRDAVDRVRRVVGKG